ncbi:type 12 methyltransferase [Candidatus Magnetomorum sp. HK-1]|nr:type 12 methyltransferase [Candidatus Magnetomorum sp. HK-1]
MTSQDAKTNFFDNLVIDIPKLYDENPIEKKENPKKNYVPFTNNPFCRLYRNPFIPLKYRRYAYRALRQVNVDLTWFNQFKEYWGGILHGRPFWGVQDIYYLKNVYRSKFQSLAIADSEDPLAHLKAWQQPETIYSLLHFVIKESLTDHVYIVQHFNKLIRKKNKLKILEFGCSLAPIAASLYTFGKFKPEHIYIADIQTLAFHYGAFRFRHSSNITPLVLTPENNFELQLDDHLDVIFCIEVFEHLNHPLETIKTFYERLNTNGLLFFNYIKGDGGGLDTMQGVEQRKSVLNFVQQNFEIVFGNKPIEENSGLIIARKKVSS